MIDSGLTEGVYQCGSDRVNWYLVEDSGSMTVIDTGFPTHWQQFCNRLDELGYDCTDVEACLLTHAHPDHIGFAARLRETCDVSSGCIRQMYNVRNPVVTHRSADW